MPCGAVEHDDAIVGDADGLGAAVAAWGSSGQTVMSQVAPASRSCFSISPAVYSEFIVVTTAPARRMPWNTVANAGTFGHSRPSTVAGADAARGERAGEHVDLRAQRAVGRLGAGGRIDERDACRVLVRQAREEVVVDASSGISTSGRGLVNTDLLRSCGAPLRHLRPASTIMPPGGLYAIP